MKNITIASLLIVCLLAVSCATAKTEVSAEEETARTVESGLTGEYSSVISGWITDDEARATVIATEDQMPAVYNASDFEFDINDYTEVLIDLSSLDESYNDGAVTVEEKKKKTTITVNGDGLYNIVLTGESGKGVTVVSEENDFVLTLRNVTITSSSDSDEQALKTKSTTTCFLVLEGENTLTGCSGTETNAVKASGSLVIEGDGTLNVNATTKNGIVSDDVIVVNGGTINVTLDSTTSGGTGIKPVNGYVQNAGVVNITGLNMTEGMENKGIKVDGDENETEYGKGKGYILINGGEITINTSGKGISAGFDSTEDGDTSSSVNDPSADVYINNGLITITTYATPREDSSSDANDGVSPEGLEGKRSVTINGGKIVINSTDDSINASEDGKASVTINGGLVYAHSSQNDALDSNGTITVNGGILIALGSDVPEGGIDCDSDSRFTYTGGTIIALGGTNQLPLSSSSTGFYLSSGMSMNIGGGFDGGNMTPPEGFDASSFTKPDDMPALSEGETMTPPEKPEGEASSSDIPQMPSDTQNGNAPQIPQGGFGGRGGMNFGFQNNGEAPSLPDGTQPEIPQGGFGGMGSLSAGDTLTLLSSDGSIVLAFTVPEDCSTSSVFVASDALGEGTWTLSSSASVVESEYTFASSLALGNVMVNVESSSLVAVTEKSTSISL